MCGVIACWRCGADVRVEGHLVPRRQRCGVGAVDLCTEVGCAACSHRYPLLDAAHCAAAAGATLHLGFVKGDVLSSASLRAIITLPPSASPPSLTSRSPFPRCLTPAASTLPQAWSMASASAGADAELHRVGSDGLHTQHLHMTDQAPTFQGPTSLRSQAA